MLGYVPGWATTDFCAAAERRLQQSQQGRARRRRAPRTYGLRLRRPRSRPPPRLHLCRPRRAPRTEHPSTREVRRTRERRSAAGAGSRLSLRDWSAPPRRPPRWTPSRTAHRPSRPRPRASIPCSWESPRDTDPTRTGRRPLVPRQTAQARARGEGRRPSQSVQRAPPRRYAHASRCATSTWREPLTRKVRLSSRQSPCAMSCRGRR